MAIFITHSFSMFPIAIFSHTFPNRKSPPGHFHPRAHPGPRPAAEPPGLRRGGLPRGGEDRAERRLAAGGQRLVLLLGLGGKRPGRGRAGGGLVEVLGG